MTEAGLFTGRGSGAGLLLNITDGSCLRLYRARWQIPRVAPGARGCAREAASVGAAARPARGRGGGCPPARPGECGVRRLPAPRPRGEQGSGRLAGRGWSNSRPGRRALGGFTWPRTCWHPAPRDARGGRGSRAAGSQGLVNDRASTYPGLRCSAPSRCALMS